MSNGNGNNSGPIEEAARDAVDKESRQAATSGPMAVVDMGSLVQGPKVQPPDTPKDKTPAEALLTAQKDFITAQTTYLHNHDLPPFLLAQRDYAQALVSACYAGGLLQDLAQAWENHVSDLTGILENAKLI